MAKAEGLVMRIVLLLAVQNSYVELVRSCCQVQWCSPVMNLLYQQQPLFLFHGYE